jgi:exopolyphosphatase/pppGpp-phosphohydrolase
MPDQSKPAERTLAVIDIGTNSAKLVIARVRPETGTVTELKFATETTRIGEGCASTGQVAASALFRTVRTLQRYRSLVEQYGCEARRRRCG